MLHLDFHTAEPDRIIGVGTGLRGPASKVQRRKRSCSERRERLTERQLSA
jgi:hypothetical protein